VTFIRNDRPTALSTWGTKIVADPTTGSGLRDSGYQSPSATIEATSHVVTGWQPIVLRGRRVDYGCTIIGSNVNTFRLLESTVTWTQWTLGLPNVQTRVKFGS
jgi:hypothetical protein